MTGKRIWRVAQVTFFVVALAYFARAIVLGWGALGPLSSTLHPNWWMIVASGHPGLASYVLLSETWRQSGIAWGGHLSWGSAARIWFISNLGRYVPGKVWQIGAMGAMAQQAG